MKHKILVALFSLILLTNNFADIVSTPLGIKLRGIFPQLRQNYIDLNQNGKLDRLEDMDEQISDFLVQDDQLQVQETLEFIKNNYRYFPVRTLESVLDALESPEGTINELIGLNYKTTIKQLIEKRIAMGEYGLYLPPSAKRKAMEEMSGYLESMDKAYRKEGSGAENDFQSAKSSLYNMLEKGYPLPEPLTIKEKEILEATLINSLIREQNDKSAVDTALYTLGVIRSTRSIPYIIPLVTNETYAVNSIRALGGIGNLEAMDLLLLSLEESDDEIKRVELIKALGSIGAREALVPLLEILKQEDLGNTELKTVLESLGKIASAGTKDRRISAALLEYLSSADPDMRIIAVNGLSAFTDQATVASLMGLFKRERSENVLQTLVDRSKDINNTSVVPSLIGLLQNPQTSMSLKVSCLEAIGAHSEGIKGINGVIDSLSSSETEIRDAAYNTAKSLYVLDSNALIGNLSRKVTQNKELSFQRQAAMLFAELPDPASIVSLTAMLGSSDPEVKRYATLALYRNRPQGNVRIATALNKIVSSENEPLDVRINAVRALGASGFDNNTLKIEETLLATATMRDRKYNQLRYYAIRALSEMPEISNESIDTLIYLSSNDRDAAIQREAALAISRIGLSNPDVLNTMIKTLEQMDLETETERALLFCEILGETGSDSFIPVGIELSSLLNDESDMRRLAYAFYMTGSEEGYENMILMGKNENLVEFISSLAESANKDLLNRVVEKIKRTDEVGEFLDLIALIETEVLFSL